MRRIAGFAALLALAVASPAAAQIDLFSKDTLSGVADLRLTAANGEKMTYWLKADHTPVRMLVMKDNSQIDVKSFTVGKQDKALFDPPAGWPTMAMPAGMGAPR